MLLYTRRTSLLPQCQQITQRFHSRYLDWLKGQVMNHGTRETSMTNEYIHIRIGW